LGQTCAASGQQSVKLRQPNKTSSISQSAVTLHRVAAFCFARSRLFEIARVLLRFDHVAHFVVNANHGIM